MNAPKLAVSLNTAAVSSAATKHRPFVRFFIQFVLLLKRERLFGVASLYAQNPKLVPKMQIKQIKMQFRPPIAALKIAFTLLLAL